MTLWDGSGWESPGFADCDFLFPFQEISPSGYKPKIVDDIDVAMEKSTMALAKFTMNYCIGFTKNIEVEYSLVTLLCEPYLMIIPICI